MNKKQKTIILSALILSSLIFIIPESAEANIVIDSIDGVMAWILGFVRSTLALILNLVSNLLTWSVEYVNFFNDGVRAGWTATRDFANLFFALALLFIAVATVVGGPIDNYSAKRMLPTFIFVALLINFSLPIVGVFIDISQIIMIEFYNAIVSGGSGLGDTVVQIMDLGSFSNPEIPNQSTLDTNFNDTIQTLFSILIITVLIFTVLWTALALVIRIVIIWLVIMTAPLAFVSSLFPPIKGIQSTWMQKFQGALVQGPVTIFIIYLGFTVLRSIAESGSFSLESLALVSIVFFIANTYAQQASKGAPGAVTKAVGWAGGAATLGLGAYVGLGGPGTNQLRKDIQKKGKQTVQLADKTVGAGATVIGKNANYDVFKENVKEDVKKGKGPLGFAQIATEDGRKYRYDQSKLGVYEQMRTEKKLTPSALKALSAADKERADVFKDNEDAAEIAKAVTQATQAGQFATARAGVKRLAQMEQVSAIFDALDDDKKTEYNSKYGSDAAKLDAFLKNELKDSGTSYDNNFRKGLEYTLGKEDQLSYAVGLSKQDSIESSQAFAENPSGDNKDPYINYLAKMSAGSAAKKITSDTFKTSARLTDSNGKFAGFKLDDNKNTVKEFSLEKLTQYVDSNTENTLKTSKNWQDLREEVRQELITGIKKNTTESNRSDKMKAFLEGLES